MKNLFNFVAVAMLMFSLNSQAQEGRKSKEDFQKQRMERLTEDLSLTPDQQKKVQTLFDQQAKNREKARAERQTQQENRAKEMESHREAFDAEMKKILSAEQYAKFEANHQKPKSQSKNARQGKKGNKDAKKDKKQSKNQSV